MPAGTLATSFNDGVDGRALTAAASGGNGSSPFDAVRVDGNASMRFDSTHTRGVGLSIKHIVGSRANAYYEWSSSFGRQSQWYGRVYVWFDALPSGDPRLVRALDGQRLDLSIDLLRTGKLRIKDSTNTTLATTSQSIATRGWVRIEWQVDQRTGTVELRVFNSPNEVTPTETVKTMGGADIGRAADRVQIGRSGTQASTSVFWTDDPALSAARYLGPVPGTAVNRHRL